VSFEKITKCRKLHFLSRRETVEDFWYFCKKVLGKQVQHKTCLELLYSDCSSVGLLGFSYFCKKVLGNIKQTFLASGYFYKKVHKRKEEH